MDSWQTRRNELLRWVLSEPTEAETREANWQELRLRRSNPSVVPDGQILRKYSGPAEVWFNPTSHYITVVGEPDEWVRDEEDHNCDAMGCGSFSHVVLKQHLPKKVSP